jgi:hypothetical protein
LLSSGGQLPSEVVIFIPKNSTGFYLDISLHLLGKGRRFENKE